MPNFLKNVKKNAKIHIFPFSASVEITTIQIPLKGLQA